MIKPTQLLVMTLNMQLNLIIASEYFYFKIVLITQSGEDIPALSDFEKFCRRQIMSYSVHRIWFRKIEDNLGKGENPDYHFTLFMHNFLKRLLTDTFFS